MKYLILLTLFTLLGCKVVSNKTLKDKEILVVYSKGSCLGKCSVYDFTIYKDGTYRYVGIKNVEKTGEIIDKLSSSQFSELKNTLNDIENIEHTFKKIRDQSIISFIYQSKTTKFHLSKIPVELKKVNYWFDNFKF